MGLKCIFSHLRFFQATKSSLSENEKREKRAMERKISEMEEELKVITKYMNFFHQRHFIKFTAKFDINESIRLILLEVFPPFYLEVDS